MTLVADYFSVSHFLNNLASNVQGSQAKKTKWKKKVVSSLAVTWVVVVT